MKRTTRYAFVAVAIVGIIFPSVFFRTWFFDSAAQPSKRAEVDPSAKQAATSRACVQRHPFTTAYRVHAAVESKLGQQLIYRSQLNFRVQLQQASGEGIFGAATDIAISEAIVGHGAAEPHPLADVLFLTGAETGGHTVFTKFDDLGLIKQHPMAILSQLFKNLSLGDQGKAYRFTYDQLQRAYRYHVSNDGSGMKRDLLALNATAALSQTLQPVWEAKLDEQCLPQSLRAEEVLPVASADNAGSVRFIMQAERIADYLDLRNLHFSAQANRNNRWNVAGVKAVDLTRKVTSEAEMWEIFRTFRQTRNAARLARAAEYLIAHVQPEELATTLMGGDLVDDEARDMIFALGMTSRPEAEDYLLDILANLPSKDDDIEMMKIRLMVAISGNDRVTDKAFNTLATLVNDPYESQNIRRNALINMGTTVRQMLTQGQDVSAVSNNLDVEIIRHLQDDESSSAIFSAGNAGLDNLSDTVTDAVLAKLTSGNQKERYASARVLSGDKRYYDPLIDHLARESSVLVGVAIVSGLRKDQLTGGQRARLQEIGLSAAEQVRRKIEELLGS